jgi:SAM-dependent methyltransferase
MPDNSSDRLLNAFSDAELSSIREYLNGLYADAYPPGAICLHERDYIGSTFAEWALSLVSGLVPTGASIQDLGCGFGAFVALAREAGFNAKGVELSSFEVRMAKTMFSILRPQDNPDEVFVCGDAYEVLEKKTLFSDPVDAITLWNILEHFPDMQKLFSLCYKAVRGKGRLFIVCPNYFAWRPEAHYQLPWSPLDMVFPRRFVKKILATEKNPEYFLQKVIRVTNWGILRALRKNGFDIADIYGAPMPLRPGRTLGTTLRRMRFWNPCVESVLVAAQTKMRLA